MTSKRRSLINLLSLSYLSKSKTTLTVSSNIKADRAPFCEGGARGREGARGGARGGGARGREGARGGARGREGARGGARGRGGGARGREGARGGARGREGARGGARGREGAHYYVCKMTSHNLHMRGRTEDEFLLVNGDPLKNHRKKPREKTPPHVRYNRGINVALL